MRLRIEENGDAMLLVPEAIVSLNESAAATLELVDGERDLDAIAASLGERFESDPEELRADVRALLDHLRELGLVVA